MVIAHECQNIKGFRGVVLFRILGIEFGDARSRAGVSGQV